MLFHNTVAIPITIELIVYALRLEVLLNLSILFILSPALNVIKNSYIKFKRSAENLKYFSLH